MLLQPTLLAAANITCTLAIPPRNATFRQSVPTLIFAHGEPLPPGETQVHVTNHSSNSDTSKGLKKYSTIPFNMELIPQSPDNSAVKENRPLIPEALMLLPTSIDNDIVISHFVI